MVNTGALESRLALLAEAGRRLSASLDLNDTVTALAQLAVPALADWSFVDVIDEAGDTYRVEAGEGPDAHLARVRELRQRTPLPDVMEAATTKFVPDIAATILGGDALHAGRANVLREVDARSYMRLPLATGDRTLGSISFIRTGERSRFTEDDLELGRELASRGAIAISNALLFKHLQDEHAAAQKAAEKVTRLLIITDALAGTLTGSEAASVIVEQGIAALGAYAGCVVVLDPSGGELRVVASAGYMDTLVQSYVAFPIESPVPLAEAVRTGRPVWVESNEEWNGHYPPTRQAESIGAAAIALMVNGRAMGAIGLSFDHALGLSDDDHAFALALAQQCAQAMERARLYDVEREARRQAEDAERQSAFLAEASDVLSSSLDYNTTLASVARLAVPHVADWCTVHIVDDHGEVRQLAAAHVDPDKVRWAAEMEKRYPFDPEGPVGVPHVLRTGEAELIERIPDELLVAAAPDAEALQILRELGLTSTMIVPMMVRDRVVGAISFVSAEMGRLYTPSDLSLAQNLANRAAASIDNARLYAHASQLAEERDQSRAEADAQRARLHTLFMEAPAIIAVTRGPEHVVELANPHFTELMGHRDVVGKPAAEALPSYLDTGFVELLDRVYAAGRPLVRTEMDVEVVGRDGMPETRYLNIVFQPTHDTELAVDGTMIHAVDVTHEVLARSRVEELAAERAAILGQMADGLIITDPDASVIFVNDAGKRLLGFESPRADVDEYARRLSVRALDGTAVARDAFPVVRALRTGQAVLNQQFLYVRPGGDEGAIECSAAPVVAEDGRALGAVLTFRDITMQRNLEREKDDFLAAAAHDLKTPLTSIKGLAQLLRRRAARMDAPGLEGIVEGLERIDVTTSRMTGLVNELLDVTRLQMDRPLDLDLRSADLCALARQAVREYQHTTEKHTLKLCCGDGPLDALVDAGRLERVLANLLSNAIKYTPERGDIEVDVRAIDMEEREWVEITVRDEGIGIPAADLPHIYDRFRRGSNAPTWVGGTGIGLAAVKHIVEQHGGEIQIASAENKGTTVTVRIPRQQPAPAEE